MAPLTPLIAALFFALTGLVALVTHAHAQAPLSEATVSVGTPANVNTPAPSYARRADGRVGVTKRCVREDGGAEAALR